MKYAAGMFRKGFTLIELLIVIALLGALAVGLLATIDPFEQLKKGRDTSSRNTVSEFYNSNLRYYAIRSEFPWGTNATSGSLDTMTTFIQTLVDAGELKERFVDLIGTNQLRNIWINSTSREHLAVCFDPESKSFEVDLNTIYDQSGATGQTDCKALGGADRACFFCIQ